MAVNWSRHMMLTIFAALLVAVAVAAAWTVESGFGTRADAGSLPLVALGGATTANGPGTSMTTQGPSSAAQMPWAGNGRLVVGQSLRMSSGPVNSGASGADGTIMTSPPTTGTHGTAGATMPTSAGRGNMNTGSTGMDMGTQSTTGTTAHAGNGGMMGTTPTTSAQSSMPTTAATSPPNTTHVTTFPSATPTTTHMGGGIGGTTSGGMGGTTIR